MAIGFGDSSGVYGVIPNAENIYASSALTPNYFPGNTVAGISPMQQQGWAQGLQGFGQMGAAATPFANAASLMGSQLGEAGQHFGFNRGAFDAIQGTNDLDYFDNPHLDDSIRAAQSGITDQFNRSVMPQMNRGLSASGPGAYSSDRAGVAEGLARSDLQKNLGNVESQMRQSAYNQGLSAYNQNRGMELGAAQSATGNLMNAGNALQGLYGMASMPGQNQLGLSGFMSGIGQQQQAQLQSQLDAGQNRWDYQSGLPMSMTQQYAGLISPYTQPTNSSSSNVMPEPYQAYGAGTPAMGQLVKGLGNVDWGNVASQFGSGGGGYSAANPTAGYSQGGFFY